ncbi:hypothetical protein Tcan_11747 [Toxocara canis]|uniref:Uncharacterized protein n=1 Tax=Toxocara canis TaxID=6265 RepID=A0A0B2UW87_TOXCA|nr:hypothetical protein Tcan_11747 [Toxocara canis]
MARKGQPSTANKVPVNRWTRHAPSSPLLINANIAVPNGIDRRIKWAYKEAS